MGLSYFAIDGHSSLDYGVVINGAAVYNAPARSVEKVNIPGRNGAVILDNGYYENITVTYPASARNNGQNIDRLRALLSSYTTYVRLTDSYHPNEYRLAMPAVGFSAEMGRKMRTGEFTVSFDCKPQRYLNSSQVTLRESGSIVNPTLFDARPLIRVYGTGEFTVGTNTVTVTAHTGSYIDIDSEIYDCYNASINANPFVSFSEDDFPVFKPGTTAITLGTGITRLVITPKFWTL